MIDTGQIEAYVAKFRAGSPNIARAFDETIKVLHLIDDRLVTAETGLLDLEGRVTALEQGTPPPPPPPPPPATTSPIGYYSNRAPGFFPPSNIDKYGVVSSEGPAPAGFAGVNLVYRSGITCQNGYTNISESECLANGWAMHYQGNVLRNQGYGGVLADPGNPGYQQRWIQASIAYANEHGSHGFWIDDTTPKVFDFYNGTYGNVWPDEHPSSDQYRAALISFANAVKQASVAAGKVAPGYNTAISADDNGALTAAWWQQFGPHAGYLTAEYWMIANGVVRKVGPEWYNNWNGWRALHGVCQSAGCKFLPLTGGGGATAQRYVLGTFLLDWTGSSGAAMWTDSDQYNTTTDPWSTFYAQVAAVGAPVSAAVGSNNVWTRQFQNGKLTVDAVNGTAIIA